jgi:hypothetical protein
MSLADDIAAAIESAGGPVVLRRLTGTQRVAMDVETYGVDSGAAPKDLVDLTVETVRTVIIGNVDIIRRQWPGPPRRDDQISFDQRKTWSNVLACQSKVVAGDVVRHNLSVQGAP